MTRGLQMVEVIILASLNSSQTKECSCEWDWLVLPSVASCALVVQPARPRWGVRLRPFCGISQHRVVTTGAQRCRPNLRLLGFPENCTGSNEPGMVFSTNTAAKD